MDVNAATMHAFKRLSSHPPAVAAPAIIAAVVRLPMDASGTMGRGWLLSPLKGGSREMWWGTRDVKEGKGVESDMLTIFWGRGEDFLVVRYGREREN